MTWLKKVKWVLKIEKQENNLTWLRFGKRRHYQKMVMYGGWGDVQMTPLFYSNGWPKEKDFWGWATRTRLHNPPTLFSRSGGLGPFRGMGWAHYLWLESPCLISWLTWTTTLQRPWRGYLPKFEKKNLGFWLIIKPIS